VAYRADIEIAVKGQAAVNKLQRDLDTLGQKIDAIAKRRVGPSNALETFNAQLREARQRLNEVVAGTTLETAAIKNYVTALGNANAAGERQNNLIANEIRLRESATNQLEKLTQRQAEFTARTNDAAQAAHRQTAEFLRQKRVALEVAKINAAAPTAQLLLAPAAPGAPAMSGGARRRITGAVERLGGARVEDEAARALRFAQASGEQIRPLSQIQSLFAGIAGEAAKLQRIKALPDSRMLNASVRGIQQLEKAEDFLNRERQESATRLKEIDRLEEGRLRRARKLQARQQYMDGETPPATQTTRARGGNGRVGGAISSALIGGGFPLLFGQGPSAAAGGALGGVAGGLLGGGFGFALSIVGTALGDIITKAEAFDKSLAALNTGLSTTGSTSITTANDVSKLASSLNVTKEEAIELVNTFKQFKDGDTREALAGLFGPVGGAATFEAIAKAGVDEKNALAAIFSLRKEIGNDAALQLALQLKSVGASTTQASLLKIILDRSIEISVAQASQVEFTDILLSIWEGIVAGVAQALSLATRFIAKMQEGSLIKLPFLDKIIAALGGVEARTPGDIAKERGEDVAAQLKADRDRIRKALAEETKVAGTESALGEALKTGKTDAQRAAEEAARIEKQTQERLRALTREVELTRQIGTVKELQFRAEMDGNKELQIRLQGEERIIRIMQATSQALDGITDKRLRQAELSKAANNIDAARQETLFEMERLDSERTKSFDAIIADLTLELKLKTATTEQEREQLRIAAERAKLEAQFKGLPQSQIDQITGLQAQVAAPLTDVQKIDQQVGKLKDEIADLTSISNIAITAAEGIGNAFAQSFQGLISGTMTAKEALGSFFKSVADMFLEMAAQIIAKQMTMIILQTILKALGAVGGGGGGGGTVTNDFMNTEALKGFTPAANGATFSNGIAKFASGGIVSSPTLFPFADGGTTKTGLMGEAGPEAIMPLKRGADGKLGVAANLDGAMSRYRRSPGAGGGGGGGEGGGTAEGGGAATGGPMAIDVRYSVERINDVEYVTASQFQAGMLQAAQQGAAQGEQRTLRRLQQSPSTRKRVGV
jgi:lambda family phage tail tape measure protein